MITKINGEVLWDEFKNVSKDRHNVYQISNNLVAKFSNRTNIPMEIEYKKQKAIHLAEISSPKPQGIFELSSPQTIYKLVKGEFYPALVMEYIRGELFNSLRGKKENKEYYVALDQFCLEKSKAKSKGFGPIDSSSVNAIWNEKKKIYLIDFEEWEVPRL